MKRREVENCIEVHAVFQRKTCIARSGVLHNLCDRVKFIPSISLGEEKLFGLLGLAVGYGHVAELFSHIAQYFMISHFGTC